MEMELEGDGRSGASGEGDIVDEGSVISDDYDNYDDGNYVLYKDRPEWADVAPIPQDEGEEPVVQIEYSPKFKDVYDYLRGVIKLKEHSQRVLNLTLDALMLNAANYSVWQYRRDVLVTLGIPSVVSNEKDLSEDFLKEFSFSSRIIQYNQKNYQVWHHRKILVIWATGYNENTGVCPSYDEKLKEKVVKLVRDEIELTNEFLAIDAKNYHAWQHRQWVLSTYKVFDLELEFVSQLLSDDVRNNSAWSHRHFIFSNMPTLTREILEKDLSYTWDQIDKARNNESPWSYMRGLIQLCDKIDGGCGIEFREKALNACITSFSNGDRNVPMMGFLIEAIMEKLSSNYPTEAIQTEIAAQVCDMLLEFDSSHRPYWEVIKSKFQALCYGDQKSF